MKLKDVTLPGEEKSVRIGMGAILVPPHTGRIMSEREQHLIAQVGCGEMQLISLESGNRLNKGVKVNDPHSLTRNELYKLCGSSFGEGPEWDLVGQSRGRILHDYHIQEGAHD